LFQPFGAGRGTVETFTVASPSAGANLTRTTSQGYWERYVAVFFTLVTSAAVANRQVALEWQDGDGNVLTDTACGSVQTATNTWRYGFGIGLLGFNNANAARQNAPLPWLFLQPSWKLVSNVGAFDAADQISVVRGVVERFPVGFDGYPIGEPEAPVTERSRAYVRNLEGS
jgi:hypothetical protein